MTVSTADPGIAAFSGLLDVIYDCALRPECWPAALEQLAGAFGASMAGLHFFDFVSGHSPLSAGYGATPDAAETLRTTYGPMWAALSGMAGFPVGEPMLLHEVIDEAQFLRKRFYLEWVQPQRWWAGWVSYRQGSRVAINSLGRRENEVPSPRLIARPCA